MNETAIISHFIGDMFPPEFIRDRKEGYLGIDISKQAMAPDLPIHLQQVHAHYAWLKMMLADGRKFIFGDATSALDLTCYQTTFLMRKNCPPDVDTMAGLHPLACWYDRIAALGHGKPKPMFLACPSAGARFPTHSASFA